MTSAKLVVPAGALLHENAGETLSPTQFGLVLLLPAICFGSKAPSLNDDELIVNTSAACAVPASSKTAAAAESVLRIPNIDFLHFVCWSSVSSTRLAQQNSVRIRLL